jgi:hypothetical protein
MPGHWQSEDDEVPYGDVPKCLLFQTLALLPWILLVGLILSCQRDNCQVLGTVPSPLLPMDLRLAPLGRPTLIKPTGKL